MQEQYTLRFNADVSLTVWLLLMYMPNIEALQLNYFFIYCRGDCGYTEWGEFGKCTNLVDG